MCVRNGLEERQTGSQQIVDPQPKQGRNENDQDAIPRIAVAWATTIVPEGNPTGVAQASRAHKAWGKVGAQRGLSRPGPGPRSPDQQRGYHQAQERPL